MPEIQTPPVVESLAEALETMAFITLMPLEDASTPPADAWLISIDFACPRPGTIELVAPATLGATLVANLLGVDPAEAEARTRACDALCELLNITCGTLLRNRADNSVEPLHVGIPAASPFRGDWAELVAEPSANALEADGHPVVIRVRGMD